MKYTILVSSAILFATALTPITAYADDNNLMCRRSSCDSRNGGGKNLSISGFDINVKSSDRGNRNRNRNKEVSSNTNQNEGVNETSSNDNHPDTKTDDNTGADHSDNDDTDNVDAGNDNTDTGNVDPGTDNTDTGASNNPPLQSNSNDIKGFDPFGGLYGPGT